MVGGGGGGCWGRVSEQAPPPTRHTPAHSLIQHMLLAHHYEQREKFHSIKAATHALALLPSDNHLHRGGSRAIDRTGGICSNWQHGSVPGSPRNPGTGRGLQSNTGQRGYHIDEAPFWMGLPRKLGGTGALGLRWARR